MACSFGAQALTDQPKDCTATRIDDRAVVAYVYDGDTLRLKDKRKVRIIGINTPEIFHDGQTSEPLAVAARNALSEILKGQDRVALQYGAEDHDRYGRLLAHVFLADGTNLTAKLLSQGTGARITFPPNLAFLDCYSDAELRGRGATAGIWNETRYQPFAARGLSDDHKGFKILNGSLTAYEVRNGDIWLNIDDIISLRISRQDSQYFDLQKLAIMTGQQVFFRGWLNRKNGKFTMRLRHPADIHQIKDAD